MAEKRAKKKNKAPRKNAAQTVNRDNRRPEGAARPRPSGEARPPMAKPAPKPAKPAAPNSAPKSSKNNKRAKPKNLQKTAQTNKPAAPKNPPKSHKENKPKPAPKPKAPVNPRSSRAVKKAMNARSFDLPRKRRRSGNYILYYLMAGIAAIVVFVILANTLLFNCASIEAEGFERYTAEEIVAASGIAVGENLLHIDAARAQENIVSSLAYIDMAKITKKYPTRIIITVAEAEKWFCVYQDGVTAAISRGGKILEHCAANGLVTVKGFEAESVEVGGRLKSVIDGKNEIPAEIMSAAEKAGLSKITEIDLTDRFDIKILYDNRITMEIGNVTDIESKLTVGAAIIRDELSSTEEVTILLTNPEVVAVRNKNIEDNPQPVAPPSETAESTAEPTAEATDEA
ncbi:MAG: FtsQ-type POTRA domain-containing protein [Oscillospiraceae bacterium]|nr:FtsQ-type POTRA domain-containing protein [Oscillospiraceae bacterium]